MKKSRNFVTIIGVVAAFIIGFLIGIAVDFPEVNNKKLSGTIGKVDNYRNVKITEADIQLRSELLKNTELQTGYLNYYSFHYNIAAELTATLDFAIRISESIDDFKNFNKEEINGLKNYRKNIDQSRSDLLFAVYILENISEDNEGAIGSILNNANMAITKLNYDDNVITRFTEVSGIYIKGKTGKFVTELMKAHDKLIMIQITKALITKDKPMLKYYDKTEIFSSAEDLKSIQFSQNDLKGYVIADSDILKNSINSDQMNSVQLYGTSTVFSTNNLNSVNGQLDAVLGSTNQLNIFIGINSNQQIENVIQNIENVGVVINLDAATIQNIEGSIGTIAGLNSISNFVNSYSLLGVYQ